jgi:Uma2 family endonuclease
MTAAAEELSWATFEDFLRREQTAVRRHEFVSGRVYVMAGGTERHDLVTGLVYERLATGARREGCRPFTSNRLVRAGDAAYYPDVLVVCGKAADRLYENDAALIVEVASPSTADLDRREKAAAYARLPSLRLYILIDPDRPRLEVAQRHDTGQWMWQAFGPGTVVPTRYGDLVVDDLYAALNASATT